MSATEGKPVPAQTAHKAWGGGVGSTIGTAAGVVAARLLGLDAAAALAAVLGDPATVPLTPEVFVAFSIIGAGSAAGAAAGAYFTRNYLKGD